MAQPTVTLQGETVMDEAKETGFDEQAEQAAAAGERERLGICAVCKTSARCEYAKVPGKVVLQCEEFEGYDPLPSRVEARATAPVEVVEPGSAADRLLGLCGSCERQSACTFNRPDSGVWHCEEYQ